MWDADFSQALCNVAGVATNCPEEDDARERRNTEFVRWLFDFRVLLELKTSPRFIAALELISFVDAETHSGFDATVDITISEPIVDLNGYVPSMIYDIHVGELLPSPVFINMTHHPCSGGEMMRRIPLTFLEHYVTSSAANLRI